MAIQQSINNMLGTVGTVAGIASALDKSDQKDAAKFEAERAEREFKADIEEAALSNQIDIPENPNYEDLYNQIQEVRKGELEEVKGDVANTRKISDMLKSDSLKQEDIEYLKGKGYQVIPQQNGENAFYDPNTQEYMSKEQFTSRAVQDQNRALARLREHQGRINVTEQLKFNKDTAYQNYLNTGKGIIGRAINNMKKAKEGNK